MVTFDFAQKLNHWYASRVEKALNEEFENRLERVILSDESLKKLISTDIKTAIHNAPISREDQLKIANSFFTDIYAQLSELFGREETIDYVRELEAPYSRPNISVGNEKIDLAELTTSLEDVFDEAYDELGIEKADYDLSSSTMKNLSKAYAEIHEFMSVAEDAFGKSQLSLTLSDSFGLFDDVFENNLGTYRFTMHYRALINARIEYLKKLPEISEKEIDGLTILDRFIFGINTRIFQS